MKAPETEKAAGRLLALRGLAGALRARLLFHAQCGLADYPFIAPPRQRGAAPSGVAPSAQPLTQMTQTKRREVETVAAEPAPVSGDPERLEAARAAMRGCAECSLATASARMFGRGKTGARLAVVGDWLTPGAGAEACFGPEEDVMLWNMMEKVLGLGPEAVYVTNLLKCAPPPGQTPDLAAAPADAARCLPHLLAELDAVRPRLVCVMGDLTARALLGGRAAVTRARGRAHFVSAPDGRYPFMVTYHPRFLLALDRVTQDRMKRAAWDDLKLMRDFLERC